LGVKMSNKEWGSVPYLDALRPDYGWHVEYAVLSSYSADLYALVAAMLALGGVDDDRGSGSKVDFANGLERLNNRLRLVVQSGRLVAPRKTPKILALLDQYIREVKFDEKDQSWHPKIALVKTRSNDDEEVEWRLWIGSRNLTRDMSWDVGLTLVGKQGSEGVVIEGVPDLGASLARRADLAGFNAKDVHAELNGILWKCPDGCDVQQIRLHEDSEPRRLPSPPTELKRLLVISPFLDGKTVGALSKWGSEGVSRVLLSTKPELLKLAHQKSRPLDGFTELLSLTAPDSDEVTAIEADTAADVKSEDEEPEPRGLHGKLILAEHADGITMWLGSANATTRGWSGPNAEVIAEASVSNIMAEGLDEFVKEFGATVQVGDLEDIPEDDKDRDRLETARTQVAARWSVAQQLGEDVTVLTTAVPPHPDDSAIQLHVASLTGN
ncbi:MAG TPA: phospholipase D family protein, partial [Planctomycetaceae bacterium]|nr:phospholipase D family protein [Planctomycetaceae bacterium]